MSTESGREKSPLQSKDPSYCLCFRAKPVAQSLLIKSSYLYICLKVHISSHCLLCGLHYIDFFIYLLILS